jgi:hypothetical protein
MTGEWVVSGERDNLRAVFGVDKIITDTAPVKKSRLEYWRYKSISFEDTTPNLAARFLNSLTYGNAKDILSNKYSMLFEIDKAYNQITSIYITAFEPPKESTQYQFRLFETLFHQAAFQRDITRQEECMRFNRLTMTSFTKPNIDVNNKRYHYVNHESNNDYYVFDITDDLHAVIRKYNLSS